MAVSVISKIPTENAVGNTGKFTFTIKVNGVIQTMEVKLIGGNLVGLSKLKSEFDEKTYSELITALRNETDNI